MQPDPTPTPSPTALTALQGALAALGCDDPLSAAARLTKLGQEQTVQALLAVVSEEGGALRTFLRAAIEKPKDWHRPALETLLAARGGRAFEELPALFNAGSDQFEGGVVSVHHLTGILERVIQSGSKYRLRLCQLPLVEVILDRSREARNDLAFLDQVERQKLTVEPASLTSYYDAGHRYICDLGAVIPSIHVAYTPAQQAGLQVLMAFARAERCPDLTTQRDVMRRIIALPPALQGIATDLAVRILPDSSNRAALSECFAVITQRNPPEELTIALLTGLLRFSTAEAFNGVLLIRDILRRDVKLLSEFADGLVAGDFGTVAAALYRQELQEDRFVERSLEETKRAFETKETHYSEVPSAETLQRITPQYQQMVAHELQLEQLPDEKLWSFCRTLGARIRPQNSEGVIPDKTRIEVFAVIREAFRRQFGVRPYNTQMLTALLLSDPKELQRSVGQARGLYAQIQTGEGKSLILSCLSAYFGLLDNRVDVITSDPLLARRDALKFGAFYERFSLPSGRYHYDPQDPVEERDLRVMYTTNDSLIFGFLAAKLEGEKFFQGRRFQIALVDEADNLCLDMSKEACRISTKIDPIVPRPVLEQMLKFVRGKGSSAGSGGIEQFLATCPAAGTISPSLIKTYLNSARYSLSLRRDTDYVVRDRKVVIVDTMNTGRLHHRSQWGAGIHEFVAMREGADAAKVRGLACQMSHPDLLLKYRQLFCISGTFGDEIDRRELAEIYNLRGFDIPRHRPSKRIDTEIELFRSSADRDNAVVRRAQELVAQGRSLLTVSHTIQQSRSLNTAMRAVGVKASLLNDVDNRDADGKECEEFEIIEKAGLPGAVANGTGVIARGADIVTTKQCDEAGGGESIAVDLPTNERTERQIRGRAGRQGKNGSSRIMVCLEDEWFRTIPEGQRDTLRVLMERPELGPSHPMTLATVKLYRVNANVLGAVERRIHHRYARVFQGPQEHYFQACQRFTEALEIKYPDLKEQPGMPRLGNPVLEPLRRKWGAQNELLKHQVDTAQIELRAALEGDDRNLPPSQFFPRILLAFERLYGFPFERIMECREEERLFRNCLRMEVEDMRRVLQRAEAHLAAPLPSAIKDTVEQLQRAVDGWIEELRVTYLVGSTPVPARKKTSEKSNAAEGRSGRNSDSKSGTKPLLTEEMEDAIDRAEERGRSQKKGGPLH